MERVLTADEITDICEPNYKSQSIALIRGIEELMKKKGFESIRLEPVKKGKEKVEYLKAVHYGLYNLDQN